MASNSSVVSNQSGNSGGSNLSRLSESEVYDFIVVVEDSLFKRKLGVMSKNRGMTHADALLGKLSRKVGPTRVLSLKSANNPGIKKLLNPSPRLSMIYRRHPYDERRYIGVRQYHTTVLDEKRQELCNAMRCVGAKAVTFSEHTNWNRTYPSPVTMQPDLLDESKNHMFKFLRVNKSWQDSISERLTTWCSSIKLDFTYDDDMMVNDLIVDTMIEKLEVSVRERDDLLGPARHAKTTLALEQNRVHQIFEEVLESVTIDFFSRADYKKANQKWIKKNWGPSHVEAFLKVTGFHSLVAVFSDNGIDGRNLLKLMAAETLTQYLNIPTDLATGLSEAITNLGDLDKIDILAKVAEEVENVRAHKFTTADNDWEATEKREIKADEQINNINTNTNTNTNTVEYPPTSGASGISGMESELSAEELAYRQYVQGNFSDSVVSPPPSTSSYTGIAGVGTAGITDITSGMKQSLAYPPLSQQSLSLSESELPYNNNNNSNNNNNQHMNNTMSPPPAPLSHSDTPHTHNQLYSPPPRDYMSPPLSGASASASDRDVAGYSDTDMSMRRISSTGQIMPQAMGTAHQYGQQLPHQEQQQEFQQSSQLRSLQQLQPLGQQKMNTNMTLNTSDGSEKDHLPPPTNRTTTTGMGTTTTEGSPAASGASGTSGASSSPAPTSENFSSRMNDFLNRAKLPVPEKGDGQSIADQSESERSQGSLAPWERDIKGDRDLGRGRGRDGRSRSSRDHDHRSGHSRNRDDYDDVYDMTMHDDEYSSSHRSRRSHRSRSSRRSGRSRRSRERDRDYIEDMNDGIADDYGDYHSRRSSRRGRSRDGDYEGSYFDEDKSRSTRRSRSSRHSRRSRSSRRSKSSSRKRVDDFDESDLQEMTYKVVMVGVVGVGKKSLMRRFGGAEFSSSEISKMAAHFLTGDIERFIISSWEESGQAIRAQQMLHRQSVIPFTKKADVLMVVYDITNLNSFKYLPDIMRQIVTSGTTPWASLVLVGNKLDMDAQLGARQVTTDMAFDLCRKFGFGSFFETSARTGANVTEVLSVVLSRCEQDRMRELARAGISPSSNGSQHVSQSQEQLSQQQMQMSQMSGNVGSIAGGNVMGNQMNMNMNMSVNGSINGSGIGSGSGMLNSQMDPRTGYQGYPSQQNMNMNQYMNPQMNVNNMSNMNMNLQHPYSMNTMGTNMNMNVPGGITSPPISYPPGPIQTGYGNGYDSSPSMMMSMNNMNNMNVGASGASVAGMSMGMNSYQGQQQQDYGNFGAPNLPNQGGYNMSNMSNMSGSAAASLSQPSGMGFGLGQGLMPLRMSPMANDGLNNNNNNNNNNGQPQGQGQYNPNQY